MSEGHNQKPESLLSFLSDLSFSVITCFILMLILGVAANYILLLENKPILGNVTGSIIAVTSIGYSVWQYRRFRRLRREQRDKLENLISDSLPLVPSAPKRRWFSFGLRTLFVAVTVVAAIGYWLASNINIVNSRRTALARHDIGRVPFRGAIGDPDHLPRKMVESFTRVKHKRSDPKASPHLSVIRRWLGDEPMGVIIVFGEPDFESIAACFPEALTVCYDPPKNVTLSRDSPPKPITNTTGTRR